MTVLAWEKETARWQQTRKELQRLAERLRPLSEGAPKAQTEQARKMVLTALPIVTDTVEAVKQHRKLGEEWYQAAFTRARDMLMPEAERLFDEAEEAETLALVYGQAFIERMFRLPALDRWEDVQSAQTLLKHLCQALDQLNALDREMPEPAHA